MYYEQNARRSEQSNEPLATYANKGQRPLRPGVDRSKLIEQKGSTA